MNQDAQVKTVTSRVTSLANRLFDGAYDSVEMEELPSGTWQNMSNIAALTVITNIGNQIKKWPVVVKSHVPKPVGWDRHVANGFYNEVAMYENILREIGAHGLGLFPLMHYGEVDDQNYENNMIILEDMTKRQYGRAEQPLFMDLDHVCMILNKLGTFHGLTYTAKRDNPKFLELKKTLRPTKFAGYWLDWLRENIEFHLKRSFKSLVNQRKHVDLLEKTTNTLKNCSRTMNFLASPEEPFATICHGDFNKNNIIFKYQLDGKLHDVVFLDLQNAMYGDPAIDLSFFLYMNTSQNVRAGHWKEMLDTYWQGLIATCSHPGFSFDEFEANFRAKAIIGLVECSYFLPVVIDHWGKSIEELAKLNTHDRRLSENSTNALNGIIEHLIDNNFIQTFLTKIDSCETGII